MSNKITLTPRTDACFEAAQSLIRKYGTTDGVGPEFERGNAYHLARQLECENQRFRNGFANLRQALQEGPGLPIELLDEADQAKWTDTITGILMALGVLEVTGKPMSPFEALMEAAKSE